MAKKSPLAKARDHIATLKAEGELRVKELELGRALIGSYERLCFGTASALRLIGEQLSRRGDVLSGAHLMHLADKLGAPRAKTDEAKAEALKPRPDLTQALGKARAKVLDPDLAERGARRVRLSTGRIARFGKGVLTRPPKIAKKKTKR
jgi:hypothetical protein